MARVGRRAVAPLACEWEGSWRSGWTSLIPLRAATGRSPALYLAYYSGDGTAQVGTFKLGRQRPLTPLFDLRFEQDGWGRFAWHLVDGIPFVLGYAMNHGNVGVERLDLEERRSDLVWRGNWSSGWTSVAGFTLEERNFLMSYRPHDGVATIDRFSRDGRRPAPLWETGDDTWPTGFTTIEPVQLDGWPFLLFYRNRDGFAALARVRRGGMGVHQTWDNFDSLWERGWFGFVPFRGSDAGWVLRYRLVDGALALDRMSNDGIELETVWRGTRPGWGYLTRFESGGQQYLLAYERRTGDLSIHRFVEPS